MKVILNNSVSQLALDSYLKSVITHKGSNEVFGSCVCSESGKTVIVFVPRKFDSCALCEFAIHFPRV